MAVVEFIVALIAILIFCRGVALLVMPKKVRNVVRRQIRQKKSYHHHAAWLMFLAGLVFVVVLIGRMDVLDMVVLLFSAMLFMTGWALLEARHGVLGLWQAYLAKSDAWYRIMGCVNVACALVLVAYLLIQNL